MTDLDNGALFEALSRQENNADMTEGRMIRFILRKVAPEVSPAALGVLLFVYDRTYSYGKTSEAISTKQFLEGIRYNGELVHPPVRLSRAQLFRAIKELCDNVIILRKTDRKSNRTSYMINAIWTPDFVVPVRNVTKAKSLQNNSPELVSPMRQGSLTSETSLSHPCNTIEQEDSNMGIRTGAAVPRSITDTLDNVLAKSNGARERHKQKGNATAYSKIWEDAFRTAYPDEQYFAWRVSELASFKRALSRGNIPKPLTRPFIEFAVSGFPTVLSERFSWMRNPPQLPTVAFVVKHVEVFYTAFRDKDDPNRKVRGVVSRAVESEAPPAALLEQTKKLEQQLAAETAARKAAEERANAAQGEIASAKREVRRKLILKRPTRSAEFGQWDD